MNDTELMDRFQKMRDGDMKAFEEVYQDMKAPLYTVIVRTLNDKYLAEDTLQEVFVKLYRSPPLSTVQKPRAYLFRMARNSALDCLRRIPSFVNDEVPDAFPDEATAGGDVDLQMDLEQALRTLSINDRQIVTLHTNGNLKFREIAELMQMPLGTVLWRYRKAIDLLRNLL